MRRRLNEKNGEYVMKLRRSDRMVVISNYLINNPYKLTSLNTFAEKYESAKSSISEDIVIIKRAFEEIEIGHIQTVTGAGGGVILHHLFLPKILKILLMSYVKNSQKATVSFQVATFIYRICSAHRPF